MANHTRYVRLAKESSYGTAIAHGDASWVVGEVESESFQQSYDVMKRNDMNYYGSAKAIVSKKTSEGSISMALQPDGFTFSLIHGIFGSDGEGASASDARTFYELAATTATELPSYTIAIGRDDYEHIYAGQVIESISISASVGEYSMLTVNTIGAKQTSSTGALKTAVPTYTGDAAHFAKSFVNFDEAATSSAGGFSNLVQSIDFEIKTNRDIDNSYALSDETCIRVPPTTIREVSGSMTFHKSLLSADATEGEPYFDELMGATSTNAQGLSNPAGSTAAISVLFEVDATNYIRFDFYKVHYEMPETSVSGRDSQTMTVNFQGLYDLGGADQMCAVTCRGADTSINANYDA